MRAIITLPKKKAIFTNAHSCTLTRKYDYRISNAKS